jgi:hypothetical protein
VTEQELKEKASVGKLVVVTKTPPFNLYGVIRGDIFRVVENCMTTEKRAGIVCEFVEAFLLPAFPSMPSPFAYFTPYDFEHFVTLLTFKTLIDIQRYS